MRRLSQNHQNHGSTLRVERGSAPAIRHGRSPAYRTAAADRLHRIR